jgi:hypothetical protein
LTNSMQLRATSGNFGQTSFFTEKTTTYTL